jgi:prevent-host-death family protein
MYIAMYISNVKRYSVAEARANLPAILDAVESGSDVELTRRGRPVAVIVARSKYRAESERPTFAEAYAAWRARHPNGVGLPDDYFEKLRDRSPGRKVRL